MNEWIIIIMGSMIFLHYLWAFKRLPQENYQFLATRPKHKHHFNDLNLWDGENLTYYGLFNANAYLLAVMIGLFLLASIGISLLTIIIMTIFILIICMPSSKILAQVIEKRPHVFSVGAASFMGIVLSPWIVYGILKFHSIEHNCICVLSAISIAYTFGEGLGRLACISFGCCYGKPLTELNPFFQRMISPFAMVFEGKTKKIAYESHLDGVKVVPIQALTAILYTIFGLCALYLFLEKYFVASFILSILITQLWRFASEFLRADYRGKGKISVYQWMSLISCLYVISLPYIFNNALFPKPDIFFAFKTIWQPQVIIFLQGIWVISFFYTGKSQVTTSKISFELSNGYYS
jgi:hypothetical protein